jgi:hypothetical protein
LNANKLRLVDLPYLPKFDNVVDSDCLDWLEYQRAVEKQYCGFKNTTYTPLGDIKNVEFNRTGTVYKTKYQDVLNSDKKVKTGKHFYFHTAGGQVFILNSNNIVKNALFTEVPGDLSTAVYRSLLNAVGSVEFYFRDSKDLFKTCEERGFVDPGFILSKVVA